METQSKYLLPGAIVVAGVMISGTVYYSPQLNGASAAPAVVASSRQAVLVAPGKILPAEKEKKMLQELVRSGVIDPSKLPQVSELNLLWAFGLANKNEILEKGKMMDPRYGGADRFAATGGWPVAHGDAMEHYSMHSYAVLTTEQQALVDRVSRGIYRPCCDNSTHFPDCNHGMAMLGLLEVLASEGASEQEMWRTALLANRTWFPQQYAMIDSYFRERGIDPASVSIQEILGAGYSSSSGFQTIAAQVKTIPSTQGGSGCGVESGEVPAQTQQSGCGV